MNRPHMRNETLRSALPMIALFMLLTLSAGLFMSLLFKQEHLRRVGRGFYGDQAVFFSLTGDFESDELELVPLLDLETRTDYIVVASVDGIRGVFFKGNPETPPMLEGRFLTAEESTGRERIAVVGVDQWEKVTTIGGTRSLEWDGRRYEVVGKMGTPYESSLNDLVMVGMGSIPANQAATGRFYVDGKNPQMVYEEISRNGEASHAFQVMPTARPAEMADAIRLNLRFGWLYVSMVTLIMMVSSSILMVLWIRGKTRAIAIYRLVGYGGLRICVRTLLDGMVPAAIGIFLAILLQYGLSAGGFYRVETTFVRQSLAIAGFALIVGLLSAGPALLRAIRVDVVAVLRRGGI